jgi:GntR family transcriptional regulator, transcriptional repressor for pyruvate dehydrogenase complex
MTRRDPMPRAESVFRPVKPVRTFDAVVAQIEQAIEDGEFAQGDRLPAERELMRIFDASRSTVREALRLLEGMDRITTRRGATGGVFVTEPDARSVASALESMVRFRQAGAAELAEFRPEFESANARLAAERATDESVAPLLRIVERWTSGRQHGMSWPELVELDLEFHQQVAAMAENEIRTAIALGLNRVVREASLRLSPETLDGNQQATQLRAIADAIAARDPEAAYEAMREHVTVNALAEMRAARREHVIDEPHGEQHD